MIIEFGEEAGDGFSTLTFETDSLDEDTAIALISAGIQAVLLACSVDRKWDEYFVQDLHKMWKENNVTDIHETAVANREKDFHYKDQVVRDLRMAEIKFKMGEYKECLRYLEESIDRVKGLL